MSSWDTSPTRTVTLTPVDEALTGKSGLMDEGDMSGRTGMFEQVLSKVVLSATCLYLGMDIMTDRGLYPVPKTVKQKHGRCVRLPKPMQCGIEAGFLCPSPTRSAHWQTPVSTSQ